MPPRRKNKKLKQKTAESNEDRISALNIELLHCVLSFLPAHEAVRTCVLSRRWREVWKSMRVLRCTDATNWGSAANFNKFVNHLLFFRDLAPLDEFELSTYPCHLSIVPNPFNDREEPLRYVGTWIRYALMRDARVLRVLFTVPVAQPLRLVDAPLISHHLTTLELEGAVLDDCSMDFSSCPALEYLEMKDCRISAHKISSLSLRHLCVENCRFAMCSQILVPNLLSLRLDATLGRAPFLQNMPLVVTAYVRLDESCRDCCSHTSFQQCSFDRCGEGYGNHEGSDDRCLLLAGLSNATNLVLAAPFYLPSNHGGVTIFKRDMKLCPMFSNLKTLVLDGWVLAREVDAFFSFLQRTPILEKITLLLYDERKCKLEMEEGCSSLETFVPYEHLKIVEVRCRKLVENVRKFVKILNTYGISPDLINVRETDN
ncbi:hypothetical protein ACP70R_021894 [Stipagrostis hirtigluma subsp. patula]